jgi:O-antigen ligase
MTSTYYSGYDEKRIVEIIILVLVLFSNVIFQEKNTNSHINNIIILLVTYLGLASAFSAPIPIYGFIEISMFIGLWSSVTYTGNLNTQYGYNRIVLIFSALMLVAVMVYLASFFVGYVAAHNEDYPKEWIHLFRGFVNIRFFNQFQVWTLPLLTLVYILKPFGLNNWNKITAVMISCWWMLLFLSAGRGALLASLFAMLVTAYIYKQYSIKFIRSHITFAISGFLLLQLLFVVIPQILYSESSLAALIRTDSPGRIILWAQASAMINEHPLLGIGPMHFAWYPNGISAGHPHNSILQWAVEWGVPSVILMLFMFSHGLFYWLKRFNSSTIIDFSNEDSQITIALFCAALSGLGLSLVSGVIVMPMSQIMMVIIIGLMMGFYENFNKGQVLVSVRESLLWKAFYLCSLVLLLISVWPSLSVRLEDDFVPDVSCIETTGPRFWRIGGIPHDCSNRITEN